MVSLAHGGTPTVNEVLQAIEILPDEQQLEILEGIERDRGITPVFAERIADLLDAQVRQETDGAREEDHLMQMVSRDLSRGRNAVRRTTLEPEGELADELVLQRDAFNAWFQEMRGLEAASAKRLEGTRKVDEAARIQELRGMLYQKGMNPSQN